MSSKWERLAAQHGRGHAGRQMAIAPQCGCPVPSWAARRLNWFDHSCLWRGSRGLCVWEPVMPTGSSRCGLRLDTPGEGWGIFWVNKTCYYYWKFLWLAGSRAWWHLKNISVFKWRLFLTLFSELHSRGTVEVYKRGWFQQHFFK